MLIGFAGPIGSGKTTAANMAREDFMSRGRITQVVSFATPLKNAAEILFGLSREQLYTLEGKEAVDPRWDASPREILQWLGTDVLRAKWPGFWITLMKHRLSQIYYPPHVVAIDDCRFTDEAEFIRSMNGRVIHLMGRKAKSKHGSHASESGASIKGNDIVLSNTGNLDSLESRIKETMNVLEKAEKENLETDRRSSGRNSRDTW